MNIREATEITGGLSNPSKMPCYSIGLPTHACRLGNVFSKMEGTVCRSCYCKKGRYVFDNVKQSQERRLKALSDPWDKLLWVDAMVTLIEHYSPEYFRFHDSGDIQNMEHLEMIDKLVQELPDTEFWLPTMERNIINQFYPKQARVVPENLNIRISTPMLNYAPGARRGDVVSEDPVYPEWLRYPGITTSSVYEDVSKVPAGIVCQAALHHTSCGDCRKCWAREIQHIVYPKH